MLQRPYADRTLHQCEDCQKSKGSFYPIAKFEAINKYDIIEEDNPKKSQGGVYLVKLERAIHAKDAKKAKQYFIDDLRNDPPEIKNLTVELDHEEAGKVTVIIEDQEAYWRSAEIKKYYEEQKPFASLEEIEQDLTKWFKYHSGRVIVGRGGNHVWVSLRGGERFLLITVD